MSRTNTMFLLPALRAAVTPAGAFRLTRKFLDGARGYADRWPGRVVVLIEPALDPDGHLDTVEVRPDELPFGLEPLPVDDAALAGRLRGAAVIVASLVDRHVRLGRISADLGVPLVVYTEYSLRTRRQIVRVETRNPLRRLRRQWWESGMERRARAVIRQASGLQCNGTPTFDAYRDLNPRALLYFDSRVRRAMLASDEVITDRFNELGRGRPLRLAFSGRLVAMKGADHLAAVAAELRRMGVWFNLDICGGGELEPRLRSQIRQSGLDDVVRLRGVLDFEQELLPFMTRDVDLFVCCHRQGDPSCTYLETMSCAVPIVGYANEALEGLARVSGAAWTTPMDQPELLAFRIKQLHDDRNVLIASARTALSFASRHTFEPTMDARAGHILECSQPRAAGVAA